MFRVSNKNGLDPAYPPVVSDVHVPLARTRATHYVAVWLKPVSAFGLLVLTMFISSSLTLVLPSSLVPRRIDACSGTLPSRFEQGQTTWLHCPGSFTPPRYQEDVCR